MTDRLEELLRQLPLRQPDASLDGRVLAGRRPRGWLLAAVAMASASAAAAALAVAVTLGGPRNRSVSSSLPQPTTPVAVAADVPTPVEPVRVDREWTEVTYEGLIHRADGPPLRAYRVWTVRDTQVDDPAEGRTVRLTEPQDNLILLASDVH